MSKWELVKIFCPLTRTYILLMPAGKISLQLITQKHPKIKVHRDKNSDADKLDCGIDLAELASVRHSLLEWLCSEGWEPFAATTDEVYLKRQI